MAKLETIHKEALKRFEIIQDKERDQRRLAIEDMRFANAEDGQWEEEAISKRKDRPRYTINRVAGAIDQVVGDQRENRTSIKFRPVSGGADRQTADIMEGLTRNIESLSNAENAYDMAFDETLTGGYGGWRVLTRFNDDDSFEQDICLKPILSAASSLWFDPSAEEYDKRDARYAFLTTDMQIEEFKDKFPNATISDFSQEKYFTGHTRGWFSENTVRIAEYWLKVCVIKSIGLLSDGRVIDLEEEKDALDELKLSGVEIVKTRNVKSHVIQRFVMNGAEILEGPSRWAGKYIPLVPVYGKVSNIDGKVFIRGIVRPSKDAQRIYNYATSAAIEAAALSPKDPIWMTPKQAAGHEGRLSRMNVDNSPIQFFNPDPELPGIPQRGGAPSVQSAVLEQVRQAAADIESTTGIYAASLGNAPQLLSERSIQSQAEKGDRGVYVFQDNLQKSIQYTGEILNDLISKIYDTPRIIRVLGIDGSSEEVAINQEALDAINQPIIDQQTGQTVIVNDLTKGKYDTIVETGPMFNTRRQESAAQLIDLANGSDVFAQAAMDLIAKNIDVIGSDELYKRIRKMMVMQGIAEPTDDEIEEMGLNQLQQPDPSQQALVDNINMQSANLQSQIEERDAKTLKTTVDAQAKTIESLKTLLEAFEKQQAMGIPLDRNSAELIDNQEGIVELGQDNLGVQAGLPT